MFRIRATYGQERGGAEQMIHRTTETQLQNHGNHNHLLVFRKAGKVFEKIGSIKDSCKWNNGIKDD